MQGVIYTGVPSREELLNSKGYPSEERMKKGKVARIECVQEIPCNPCEGTCPIGSIKVGKDITNLPELIEDSCTGCGLCVANCPGLAITIIDKSAEDTATIEFPFEYIPLPVVGDEVDAVGRDGEIVCKGEIVKIKSNIKAFDGTTVVVMSVPMQFADDVVSMKRLPRNLI